MPYTIANIRTKALIEFKRNASETTTNDQYFNAGYHAAWEHLALRIAVLEAFIDSKITKEQMTTAPTPSPD